MFDKNSLSEQPISPPDRPYREVQDENAIRQALEEVDELESSLTFLDRAITPDSHFKGFRGGEDKLFDAFRSLAIVRKDLEELLRENPDE